MSRKSGPRFPEKDMRISKGHQSRSVVVADQQYAARHQSRLADGLWPGQADMETVKPAKQRTRRNDPVPSIRRAPAGLRAGGAGEIRYADDLQRDGNRRSR